jgi:poly-gamma-glutamate synthesis protein (capsule biosynthesis protein)
VLVFGLGLESSGIPRSWAAKAGLPGVALATDFAEAFTGPVWARMRAQTGSADLAIASIHWGPNWGYGIAAPERALAHDLIDRAGVALVHGHSSHHAKAIEIYNRRLILYGCGDFLTDYEGIAGYGQYRGDLALLYLPELTVPSGELAALTIEPFRVRRFRLERAGEQDALWLERTLNREYRRFGASVALGADGTLQVEW